MNSLQRRDVLLCRFQRDWYAAFLTSLRVRHTNGYPSINATPKLLKAGPVVLVRHPVKSRPYCSMARITEIVPGSDGEIRVVHKVNNLAFRLAICIPWNLKVPIRNLLIAMFNVLRMMDKI